MSVTLNFDARTVEPSTGTAEALPAGWYNVAIEDSEMKPTRDGSGAMLVLSFRVLDGQYANRKIASRLNLRNNNAQAVEIAYRDLSAICHAVQVVTVQDSAELHGKPLKIKVAVRPARQDRNAETGEVKEYEASNDVKAYKGINEPTGAAPASAPPAGFGGVPAGFGAPQAAPAGFGGVPAPAPAPQGFPAAQAPAPSAPPAWQAPAVQQPWAAAPQQAQAPAPVPTPTPAPTAAPAPVAAAPQPAFAAPAAQQQQPAWMTGAAGASGAPAWATQTPSA